MKQPTAAAWRPRQHGCGLVPCPRHRSDATRDDVGASAWPRAIVGPRQWRAYLLVTAKAALVAWARWFDVLATIVHHYGSFCRRAWPAASLLVRRTRLPPCMCSSNYTGWTARSRNRIAREIEADAEGVSGGSAGATLGGPGRHRVSLGEPSMTPPHQGPQRTASGNALALLDRGDQRRDRTKIRRIRIQRVALRHVLEPVQQHTSVLRLSQPPVSSKPIAGRTRASGHLWSDMQLQCFPVWQAGHLPLAILQRSSPP